jgi:hydrogenase maturation protease
MSQWRGANGEFAGIADVDHASDRVSRDSPFASLVIGLGNPLRGDDGVGPRVVAELSRRGLPEGVEALDIGTGGLDLLRVLEGQRRVVIVDAADIGRASVDIGRASVGVGREPGRFVRFTLDEARLIYATDHLSFHHAGLGEILALCDALGRELPHIVIFGVQPAEVGWGEGLSPPVEARLPALIDAVLEEIRTNDGR